MYYTVSNDTRRQTFMKHTRKQVVNPFQSVVPAFTYGNNTGKTPSRIKKWWQSERIWCILNTSLLVLWKACLSRPMPSRILFSK